MGVELKISSVELSVDNYSQQLIRVWLECAHATCKNTVPHVLVKLF